MTTNARYDQRVALVLTMLATIALHGHGACAQSTFPDPKSGKARGDSQVPASDYLPGQSRGTALSRATRPGLAPEIAYPRAATSEANLPGNEGRVAEEGSASRRGLYAAVGFFTGAIAGWIYGDRICRRDNCMIPVSNVLFAAVGGGLGALIGLFVAPSSTARNGSRLLPSTNR